MKIKFKNLGTIRETELDLRPLTIIIGPNNSNKTYIAYSLYGLWQRIQLSRFHSNYNLEPEQREENTWILKIDDQFLDRIIRLIKIVETTFEGGNLTSFFQDSSGKIFTKTSFDITISRQEVKEAIYSLENRLFYPDRLIEEEIKIQISSINEEIKISFDPEEKNEEMIMRLISLVYSRFVKDVLSAIFTEIFPFPAERNAFINTYKILENRRYKLLKETQRGLFSSKKHERQLDLLKEQGDTRYPQPVEDFLDFLSDIELQENIKITANNKNEFQQLADLIEEKLQNKNKTNLKATKLGGKELKVAVKKGLEIDIYNASSSIKQLAPLLLYLRYRASKGNFLVIDEPEMNLHPESQAKLLEALSILVHLGVKILLTTHSPYIMAHLNNLVNGDNENTERLQAQSSFLYLQDSRAFLPIDQVSAYEMKDNKLVSLNDPDYGIRWDTLSDVSVDIQQKYFEIYEAGKQEKSETEEE